MITVHGRTRSQFYKGAANWTAIANVKSAISVPLIVNGDISCLASAKTALMASGADAIMVGRAHYGAPWTAGAIAVEAKDGSRGRMPSGSDLADYVAAHYEAMLSLYGRERGMRHARKHLGWYVDKHLGKIDPETRSRMMTATRPQFRFVADRKSIFCFA